MTTPELFYDSEEIKKGNNQEFPNSLETKSRPVTKEEHDLVMLKMKKEQLLLELQDVEDEMSEIIEKTSNNLN